MVELLRYANFSKVATALQVSRSAAARWSQGKDVTPQRLRQVEDLLRPAGPDDLPEWTKRLLTGMFALERRAGITERELAEVQAEVAALRATDAGPRQPTGAGARGAGAASAGRPSTRLLARPGR